MFLCYNKFYQVEPADATENLEQAKEFFSLLTTKGSNTETIKETIKTIEIDDKNDN